MASWSSRIKTGGKEPVTAFAYGIGGNLLIGKTDLKIHVRRLSDGFYFDWSDNYFKSSGSVVQMLQELAQVDPVNSPGEYHLDDSPYHELGFDTSSILNATPDETYYVTAVQDGGSDIVGLPYVGEIKVGDYIDDIGVPDPDRYPVIW